MFRIPNDAANDNQQSHAAANATTDAPANNNQSSYFLWATREMAALDFLTNIPLRCEKDIVRAGLAGVRYDHFSNYYATAALPHGEDNDNNNNNNRAKTTLTREMSVREEEDIMQGGDDILGFDTEINSHLDTLLENEFASLDKNLGSIATTSSTSTSTRNRATTATTRWWDKLVVKDKRFFYAANREVQRREWLEMEEKELERPSTSSSSSGVAAIQTTPAVAVPATAAATTTSIMKKSGGGGGGVPGRRLDGLEAITITIPSEFRRRPGMNSEVTRRAAVREWEIKVAYNNNNNNSINKLSSGGGALLDGRVFFATRKSYPVAVYSTIKYEPKKEETLRRRKQLELLGGGGTQFVLPKRDWRGISYRALLPRKKERISNSSSTSVFNRLSGVDSNGGGTIMIQITITRRIRNDSSMQQRYRPLHVIEISMITIPHHLGMMMIVMSMTYPLSHLRMDQPSRLVIIVGTLMIQI